jgi:hypothetical protein
LCEEDWNVDTFQSSFDYRENYEIAKLKFFLTRPLKNGILKFAMHKKGSSAPFLKEFG